MISEKQKNRERRRVKIRATVKGAAHKPRLVVHKSLMRISAQLIDDTAGKTICAASDIKSKTAGKVARAKEVGAQIAKLAQEKKITTVVFDRAGHKYHGRVKALADGAREGGLLF